MPAASSRSASAKGDRLALVAETGPEFAACFFGAIYAGLWPVPLPLPTSFGGREAYVDAIASSCSTSSDPQLFLFPPELAEFAGDAAAQRGVAARDWDSLADIDAVGRARCPPPAATTSPICNIRAGSTRFPHGVAVTHRALLDNLRAHGIGIEVQDSDRCISWLPWYHDMGLVGCMLSPLANQVSVDYLKTEDFARRPLAWLDLISRNPGTTLSYSPTFGYDICSRRMSVADPRRRPLRPVALADRRQWRRHDPPRRDAGVRRQLRRRRLQGGRLLPELRPRRSDAGGVDHAAGRRHPPRTGRGKRAVGRRHAGAGTPAPLPRDRQLRQAGDRHGSRGPRRRRRAPRRPLDRQVVLPRHVGHGRLFPRRGIDPRLPRPTTAGSTPATWATCRAATSSSSAAPRT